MTVPGKTDRFRPAPSSLENALQPLEKEQQEAALRPPAPSPQPPGGLIRPEPKELQAPGGEAEGRLAVRLAWTQSGVNSTAPLEKQSLQVRGSLTRAPA